MVKEYPLEGVKTQELNISPDERGFFAEALRQDWRDFIDEWIAQSFRAPIVNEAQH